MPGLYGLNRRTLADARGAAFYFLYYYSTRGDTWSPGSHLHTSMMHTSLIVLTQNDQAGSFTWAHRERASLCRRMSLRRHLQ